MSGIRVRLFGSVKEIVGSGEIEVPAAPGATTGSLLAGLIRAHPRLEPWGEYLRVAVNQEYAPGETPVAPGDEVAIIPPVSGG